MSSSQQYMSSEFSDMVQPNISSALVSENTLSVTHVQQTGISQLIIILSLKIIVLRMFLIILYKIFRKFSILKL